MSTPSNTLDRRAALKARHRQAILDSADALIRERGKPHFSVDELAERADVSRRTVFNHFASLDEIVMLACTKVVTDAVDEFREVAAANQVGGGRVALFTEITSALRGMDLASVVAYLWGVLAEEGDDGRSQTGIQAVFTRSTEHLSLEIAGRSTELDEFESEVLVSSLINGIAVVARHWIIRTGGALDASSRAVWTEMLDRLITTVQAGYSPPD